MALVLLLFGPPNLIMSWGVLTFGVHRMICRPLAFEEKRGRQHSVSAAVVWTAESLHVSQLFEF